MDNYSSRRDDDMESLDELLFDISRYQNKTDYWKLLKFLRKFRYLSPFNGMLVHLQKEGSEFVLSPTKWKNRFNRIIKANAQPIVILKPFGPVSLVYDINDTEPDPQLRVVPIPEDILHPFKAEGSVPQEMLDRLINNLPREGVRYQEADLGAMMAGFIRVAPKGLKQSCGKTRDGKIKELPVYFDLVINSKLKAEERLPVIAHELGHMYCGHLGCPYEWWEDRKVKKGDLKFAEFEAESVSWLVCSRLDIKTSAASYLGGYCQGRSPEAILKEMSPRISINAMLKAAGQVERLLNEKVKVRTPGSRPPKELVNDETATHGRPEQCSEGSGT